MENNTHCFHSLGHTEDQSMVHMETLQILGSSKGTPFSLVSNQRPRGQHKPSFLCSWTSIGCLLHAESCAGPQETRGMGRTRPTPSSWRLSWALPELSSLMICLFYFLFSSVYSLNLLSNVGPLSCRDLKLGQGRTPSGFAYNDSSISTTVPSTQ